jgi:hypothetical protein
MNRIVHSGGDRPLRFFQGIFALLLLFAVVSCGSGEEAAPTTEGGSTVHGQATDTIVSSGEPVKLEGCYQRIVQRDTATLFLNIIGNAVTGKLVYNHYQKDDNTGSLKGELRDNHIYADYLFQSEGGTATRAVAFRIQDTLLLEGSGEVEERDGKMSFRNPDQLRFDTTHPFRKVDCRPEDQ